MLRVIRSMEFVEVFKPCGFLIPDHWLESDRQPAIMKTKKINDNLILIHLTIYFLRLLIKVSIYIL